MGRGESYVLPPQRIFDLPPYSGRMGGGSMRSLSCSMTQRINNSTNPTNATDVDLAGSVQRVKALKVLSVFGTRPEAIPPNCAELCKVAPMIHKLQKRSHIDTSNVQHVTVKICVTGQHRQIVDQGLRLLCLPSIREKNLLYVRVPGERILVTGSPVIDTLH